MQASSSSKMLSTPPARHLEFTLSLSRALGARSSPQKHGKHGFQRFYVEHRHPIMRSCNDQTALTSTTKFPSQVSASIFSSHIQATNSEYSVLACSSAAINHSHTVSTPPPTAKRRAAASASFNCTCASYQCSSLHCLYFRFLGSQHRMQLHQRGKIALITLGKWQHIQIEIRPQLPRTSYDTTNGSKLLPTLCKSRLQTFWRIFKSPSQPHLCHH